MLSFHKFGDFAILCVIKDIQYTWCITVKNVDNVALKGQ